MNNLIKLSIIIILALSCVADSTITVDFLDERGGKAKEVPKLVDSRPIGDAVISDVELNDSRELVITGTDLDRVDVIKVNDGEKIQEFEVVGKTETSLILGGDINILLSNDVKISFENLSGSVDHTLTFPILPSSISKNQFSPMDEVTGGTLQWNGSEWEPTTIPSSGTAMKGTWDGTSATASDGATINDGCATSGDYYIVSDSGSASVDGHASWKPGDWIMCNGTTWDKVGLIDTSGFKDMDLQTTTPNTGAVLFYNGSSWSGANDLSVTSGEVGVVNDFVLKQLEGQGTKCLKVNDQGGMELEDCDSVSDSVTGSGGSSVTPETSGSVTVVGSSNSSVSYTIGGINVMTVSTGGVEFNDLTISVLLTPTSSSEIVSKKYIDDNATGTNDNLGNHTAAMDLSMSTHSIVNLGLINGVDISQVATNTVEIVNNALRVGGQPLSLSGASSGNVLMWDGSKWYPGTDTAGAGTGQSWQVSGPEGIHPSRLGNLGDSVANNKTNLATIPQSITHNVDLIGVNSTSITYHANRINDLPVINATPTVGDVISWDGSKWIYESVAPVFSTLTVGSHSVEANDPRLPTSSMPSQSGNANKFLKNLGSSMDWVEIQNGIQGGITSVKTEGAGCTQVGEIARNPAGQLMVCEDTTKVTAADCAGLGVGAMTINSDAKLVICTN